MKWVQKEIHELLHKVGYGHLGCIHEGKPYVMPMNYYLEEEDIYLFTTIGMKIHDLDANPKFVCRLKRCASASLAQRDREWSSFRLTEQEDIDRVMHCVKERNPMLSPAINRTWIDTQGRSEVIAIYRIDASEMSGRTTDGVSSH